MIIDFHTHIFPDAIASKTIEHLETVGNTRAFADGTLIGLKESMKQGNIDISVVLPVATKPSQFQSINDYACKITNKDGIISFGGLHPDSVNYKEELRIIKETGLLGIKLHPDYQNTYADDIKILNIIDFAASLDLIVVSHAGIDIGLPNPVHCTPIMINSILKTIDYNKLIFAHLGGFRLWDEVEDILVGKDVFFDIGYCLDFIEQEQFIRIVTNHGSDKILFATDSPWGGQKETLEQLRKCSFTKEQMDNILFENARKLLGISKS